MANKILNFIAQETNGKYYQSFRYYADNEAENGLESQEVDLITANIINERNPVCYGKDDRWANHLRSILNRIQFVNL